MAVTLTSPVMTMVMAPLQLRLGDILDTPAPIINPVNRYLLLQKVTNFKVAQSSCWLNRLIWLAPLNALSGPTGARCGPELSPDFHKHHLQA